VSGPGVPPLTPEQIQALVEKGEQTYASDFPEGFAPGTGPGHPVQGATNYDYPLQRNVHVGGLWVSSCLCPQCGARYGKRAR